jgi:hypothetical protein
VGVGSVVGVGTVVGVLVEAGDVGSEELPEATEGLSVVGVVVEGAVVVGVVVVGVPAAGFGVAAPPEDVDVVAVLSTLAEWGTVSVATSTPSPMAPAVAATPMVVVARRTRTIAPSLASSGDGRLRRRAFDCCTMPWPFAARSDRVRIDGRTRGIVPCWQPVNRPERRASPTSTVSHL